MITAGRINSRYNDRGMFEIRSQFAFDGLLNPVDLGCLDAPTTMPAGSVFAPFKDDFCMSTFFHREVTTA